MIKRELSIFLVVGILAVVVDYVGYRGLLWLAITDTGVSKAMSFILGTIFAYFANKMWTFGHKEHEDGSIVRFICLYMLTLGANVYINASVLDFLSGNQLALQVAFVVATGVSASLNFIGMKVFVFREVKI